MIAKEGEKLPVLREALFQSHDVLGVADGANELAIAAGGGHVEGNRFEGRLELL
ncbi:MAG: hypothetical protein ACYCR4_07825 [Acidimicrobiales bacterium]